MGHSPASDRFRKRLKRRRREESRLAAKGAEKAPAKSKAAAPKK